MQAGRQAGSCVPYLFEDVLELSFCLLLIFAWFCGDVGTRCNLGVGMEKSFGLLKSVKILKSHYLMTYLGF